MKEAIKEAQDLEKQIMDGSLEVPFDTEVPSWTGSKHSNRLLIAR